MSKSELTGAEVAGCVFALIWFPVWMVLGFIFRGWVLMHLWLWFAVPIFNVPALNIPQAIGLALVVSFLTHQSSPDCQKEKKGIWETILTGAANTFIPPLLAYIVGAIVRSYL